MAAIGGTDEVMGLIADGTYEQVGTFNGNPLSMAAARATLLEALTPRRVRARRPAGGRPARRVIDVLADARRCPGTSSRSAPRAA